ncbi:MAG TPA: hypothetical protein VJ761_04045 [Ktedonobacteraceae bacterium]|nr:hypothetical protein [Ktedonobacteraceae bacterium]
MTCRKKLALPCHSERREESLATGSYTEVARGFFAALRMTGHECHGVPGDSQW